MRIAVGAEEPYDVREIIPEAIKAEQEDTEAVEIIKKSFISMCRD